MGFNTSIMGEYMSQYQGDIKKIKAMYDAVAEGIVDEPHKLTATANITPLLIVKCNEIKLSGKIDISKKQKMAMFLGSLADSFKKTSEEHKYCDKLIKTFEDMNFESMKFFIISNYDRFDEIHTLAKKYEENFDEKEVLRYEARFNVLSKAMMFLLEENL